jgi:hypothetical protein
MTSREVADAVGLEGESAEAKVARLSAKFAQEDRERAELAAATEAVARKQHDAAMKALRAKAEARLLGIRRAAGSLAASADQDDARAYATARAFATAMGELDARYVQYVQLRDEAERLAVACGLPRPTLAAVPIPSRRRAVVESLQMVHDVPERGTAHGIGLDDAAFAKTEGGQIAAELGALGVKEITGA